MEHQPRPTGVLKNMERKLQKLKHLQSLLFLKRSVCRKNIKEGKCQNKYFPLPLKMIPVKRVLAAILLHLGDLQKPFENWDAIRIPNNS